MMKKGWFQRHKLLVKSLLLLFYASNAIWWIIEADENSNKIRLAGRVLLGIAALYIGSKSFLSWRKQLHSTQTEA